MQKIEIRYEDLLCILGSAEAQLKEWIIVFNEEDDKKLLNKVRNLKNELLKSGCMDYAIIEND